MKIDFLSIEQVQSLLAAVKRHGSARDLALFTVSYWRGLRIHEPGLLLISDWRPDVGRLHVRRGKGSVSGEYKVTQEEGKALAKWLAKYKGATGDMPLFPSERKTGISANRVHQLMKRYGELAGLPADLRHFHVLKHSIGTHMAHGRYTPQEIKDWLGHKSLKSTEIYMAGGQREEIAKDIEVRFRGGKKMEGKGWRS